MRVLVLGGTALVGPHVVRGLVARGHEVTVCHRGEHEAELPDQVRHLHADKARLPTMRDEFRRLRPEVAVNTTAITGEDAANFAKAFVGIAKGSIVISSIDVYRAYGRLHRTEPGPPDPVPLAEDAPLRTRHGPEGAAHEKLDVERIALGSPDLPTTVLRYPAVYGPGDYHRRLRPYVRRMLDGREVIPISAGFAGWRFSRGYAEDLAAGVVLAIEDPSSAGRVYNLAESDALEERQWASAIGEALDWRGQILEVDGLDLPADLAPDLDFAQDWVVDTARVRTELGYDEPVGRAEGLRRAVDWKLAQPRGTPPNYAGEDEAISRLA